MALVAALAVWVVHEKSAKATVQVTASSSAPGTDPQSLVVGAAPEEGPAVSRRPVWRSAGETVGAWLRLRWSAPRRVDHVRLTGARDRSQAVRAALLIFDDGPSVLVAANSSGDLVSDFPARTVRTVQLMVADVAEGARSVALAAVAISDSAAGQPESLSDRDRPVVTASSNADLARSALSQGPAAGGDAPTEWTAAPDDAKPWVQLNWRGQREVASVQLLGPATGGAGPGGTSPPLRGVLRFDDGSTVVVSGIASGGTQLTTVAFAPRMAESVRLELTRGSPQAAVALSAFEVHGAGTTGARWPRPSGGYATTPPADDCAGNLSPSAPVSSKDPLVLVCPSPGAAVGSAARIVVAADPGAHLRVVAALAPARRGQSIESVATATADLHGRAQLTLDASALPEGPVTLAVSRRGARAPQPLYVQLVHYGGVRHAARSTAPQGMTLQWSDDFTRPVSASFTGSGAIYAAAKPTSRGVESFGDAPFADPAERPGAMSTVAGDYLRLRARDAVASPGSNFGSLLSSLRADGSGFSAQYGYFEARMLGAPGPGAWPAFWMLNSGSTTSDDRIVGEADAVELYGRNTMGSCHSTHDWDPAAPTGQSGDGRCLKVNGFSDWAMTWHTYGVRIVPDGAICSIDGVEVARLHDLGRSEEPFFFMLDLALGGGWPVDLSATSGTTDLYVDWVHVYT